MKISLVTLILIGNLAPAIASTQFEFLFHYPTFQKDFKFKVEVASENDYEKAFEKASLECFQYFKNGNRSIGEDETSDLIDSCANPVVKTIK
jgi:hypothetical protein